MQLYKELNFKFATRFQKQICHNVVTMLSQGCERPCKQGCSNLIYLYVSCMYDICVTKYDVLSCALHNPRWYMTFGD